MLFSTKGVTSWVHLYAANTHPTYQKDLRQPKVDKWKVPGEAERPTVVIDLRPGRTASTSDVVAQEGKEQQQSERLG